MILVIISKQRYNLKANHNDRGAAKRTEQGDYQ